MKVGNILDRGTWRPIRGCPGRYVLHDSPTLTAAELLGSSVEVRRFHSATVADPVLIVPLADGALLSYEKADGTFLHTLNTSEGFHRKLRMLGLKLGCEAY